ncbi:MAG: hypothetical protein WA790_00230 [Sulfitobacter sp.]
MTERKQALQDLLVKVEAGEWEDMEAAYKLSGINSTLVRHAYNGSLDAALALHNAVLDNKWIVFSIDQDSAHHWYVTLSDLTGKAEVVHTGHESNLARAWLIAILKALISEEGE